MTDSHGLTGEETIRLIAFREIEQLLVQGFRGQIILHCPGNGTVGKYETREFRTPGQPVQSQERTLD